MWNIFLKGNRTYDGLFYVAVKTTKIYCRPSCKSRKPKKQNVAFYLNRKEVERAGYRACKRCQPEVDRSPQEKIVQQAVLYLMNHMNETVTLEKVAEHVGVSPFHLERIFKQEMCTTPRTYLEKMRIEKAIHLLEHTSKTNLDICYEVGFNSPSSFYKVFKKRVSLSPHAYRRMEINRSE
ncbi:methylphosphotriester-DNA--protein-cysteine methyltransferase family protein [Radiobacillus deserti]|uniref:Methylphosphotriester-DNA--protein-cysteine methyltransferase family protein n=2 Tax=Radiobacillus deserti TaxID=2594883 RepID=A0A516KLJ1_9BACI|nr:Ada metal-binding domain-containing protein [Radiobacillus deserti]QDP42259.1 methylphosphotriester-DNA--protein-cysteine methyltransferase family protein [Radiobacillus deserti]